MGTAASAGRSSGDLQSAECSPVRGALIPAQIGRKSGPKLERKQVLELLAATPPVRQCGDQLQAMLLGSDLALINSLPHTLLTE